METTTQSSGAVFEPGTIRTRGGLEVVLIGRRSVTSVWARRVSDGAVRDYWHSELIADRGAAALMAAIGLLPLISGRWKLSS